MFPILSPFDTYLIPFSAFFSMRIPRRYRRGIPLYKKKAAAATFFLCNAHDGAYFLYFGVVGGTGLLDFFEQMLLRVIEQQALVVCKVGLTPEILDEP